jgi:hypothetical protein
MTSNDAPRWWRTGAQPRETTMSANNERESRETLVCGCQIQQDASGGQGHCWRNVDADDIPANIREEIEAEMLDGGREGHPDYTASNGQHYRW